jgi:hypothetical protein
MVAQARDSLEALRTDLTTETTTRTNADTAIRNQISAESAARINSDTSIQNQITTINQQLPPHHYIGERYAGGIVFYVDDDGQHGLIAALADQSVGVRWSNGAGNNRTTGARGDGIGAGKMNTAIIVATQIGDKPVGASFAAKSAADFRIQEDGVTPCAESINGTVPTSSEICYGDWYLPSKYELNLLIRQRNVLGGFVSNYYWSSMEKGSDFAWIQNLLGVQRNDGIKDFSMFGVRAIRAF